MSVPRNSTKTRRICFETHRWQDEQGRWRLTCSDCGLHMDPVRDAWIAHHYVRFAEGGTDDQTVPRCKRCDDAGTPADISAVAKGKRISDRHYGVKKSRGFAGWRKFDGTPVRNPRR